MLQAETQPVNEMVFHQMAPGRPNIIGIRVGRPLEQAGKENNNNGFPKGREVWNTNKILNVMSPELVFRFRSLEGELVILLCRVGVLRMW